MARAIPTLTDSLTAVLGPAPVLGVQTALGWLLAALRWSVQIVRHIFGGTNGLP
jgi:hypothetical protein